MGVQGCLLVVGLLPYLCGKVIWRPVLIGVLVGRMKWWVMGMALLGEELSLLLHLFSKSTNVDSKHMFYTLGSGMKTRVLA